MFLTKNGDYKLWNDTMIGLCTFIGSGVNQFEIPDSVFNQLPDAPLEYEYDLKIRVKRRYPLESEDKVLHWLVNKIDEIGDINQVIER